MKKMQGYETFDGKFFKTKPEAEAHECIDYLVQICHYDYYESNIGVDLKKWFDDGLISFDYQKVMTHKENNVKRKKKE